MSKKLELPTKKSWYNALNWQVAAGVVANCNHISADNWYLSNCINISCEIEFENEKGELSPRPLVDNTHPWSINSITKYEIPKKILNKSLHEVIENIIDENYYFYFNGVDDYYIRGIQGMNKNHYPHDGLLSGYNNGDNTYTIFSYDMNNKLKTFKISKYHFEKGFFSKYSDFNTTCLVLKNNMTEIKYRHSEFIKNITCYCYSQQTDKYKSADEYLFGYDALNHINEYIHFFKANKITANLFDIRVFLTLYENKFCIYNSLLRLKELNLTKKEYCVEYFKIVELAERLHMLSIRFKLSNEHYTLELLYNSLTMLIKREKSILIKVLTYYYDKNKGGFDEL